MFDLDMLIIIVLCELFSWGGGDVCIHVAIVKDAGDAPESEYTLRYGRQSLCTFRLLFTATLYSVS